MSRHDYIIEAPDEPAHDRPRCPRCSSWNVQAVRAGHWCLDCDLASIGTRAEWDAMATERRQWAEGHHPAQQAHEAAPAPPQRPRGQHPCETCGVPHATRPEPRQRATHRTTGRPGPLHRARPRYRGDPT